MRDLQADLEEWNGDLINGTRSADWFYLVTEYIERAIKAEEEVEMLREEAACHESDQQAMAIDRIDELSKQVIKLQKALESVKTEINEYFPHDSLKLPKYAYMANMVKIIDDALAELEVNYE